MRKLLLICAILVPFLGISQALSGTYVVGNGQPIPFNTLTNAVARINSSGVSGPVVFLLNDAAYTNASGEVFPLKINQFAGTSLTNTLTIKPNVGKTVAITGSNLNTYSGVASIFQFDGGDNIIVDGSNTANGSTRDLTIVNNDNINYVSKTAIWISSNGTNGANNISILNTKLQMITVNANSRQLSGVFSGSNSLGDGNGISGTNATAANSNLTVSNNEFINVRQGIIVKSSETSSLRSSDIQFTFNVLGRTLDSEKPSTPINFINVNTVNILDNTIIGVLNTGSSDLTLGVVIENSSNCTIKRNILQDIKTIGVYIGRAIWIKGTTTDLVISENKISNVKNTANGPMYGIHLDVSSGSTGTLLANNFISDISSTGGFDSTGSGILIANGLGTRIYHNTVALNALQSGTSSALYLNAGTAFDIRNNIFTNTSKIASAETWLGPYAIYAKTGVTFDTVDHNDYYSSLMGRLGSVVYTTLAEWQIATGKDQNSKNINPAFVSIADLHLQSIAANSGLDNAGTSLALITTDIDGQARTATPDIGADEFSVVATLAAEPIAQSSALNFTDITANSFKIDWTKGSGTGANSILVVREGTAVNSAPLDATTYNPSTVFGSGSQIGTGNYVVYAGNGNTVTVTGLSSTTTYYVAIYEYNGAGSTANYLTTAPLNGNRLTLNAALGWQIVNTNLLNTITFDNTVSGVTNGAYVGSGFTTSPTSGQLNSNSWAVDGFEDGTITFGGTNTNPDFGKGIATGGISESGIYAFQTSPNNVALGIQPGTEDFTPGTITLRFQNQTSSAITSISLGYKVYVYNDEPASNSFNFSHSADNTNYTGISELDVVSPTTADVSPSWKASYRVVTITGLNIPSNGFYYLKWSGAEVIAGSAYDQFAIDDIVLSANPTSVFPTFEGIAENFSVHGATSLSGDLTVNGDLKFTAGKLSIKASTLTVGGPIINTISGGIEGSASSNISIIGSGNKTLSFDQTTIGTTNLLNNFLIPFSAGANNMVTIANAVTINGLLSVALDQTLDFGTNQLTGNLSTITINGTVLTQNAGTTPFPAGKTWSGTGKLNLNASSAPQTLVAGTYTNLTLSSTGGTTASTNLTVNGVLNLPSANPSATVGGLSMANPSELIMGPLGTNTGTGDVSGIISRSTILPNVQYTFGHRNSTILFTNVGTLPDWMKVKVTIGQNNWRTGAIKRYYDIIQSGAANTKAIIREHYLDSELNGNTESKLVNWGQFTTSGNYFEQGRSNISTTENWVEITNANLGLYFENTFGKVFLTLDETEAEVLTWNGSLSNSWTTVGNWTANNGTTTAIPSSGTKVIIPNLSNTFPQPTLNPNTQVLSIEIESGAVVNSTPNDVLEVFGTSGAWINNGGIFNAPTGTGKVIFKTLDASISGSTTFNNIEIANGASLRTLEGSKTTISGAFTNNGILLAGLNPNTIEYSGNGQTVIYANGTSFESYYNLIISGANATFPTSVNIRGDLTLNAPVDFTDKTINLIGVVNQKLEGSAIIDFNNLVVNKASGTVLLEKAVAVNGTLTLTKGRVILGSNNLTLGANAVVGTFDVNTMIVADGSGFLKRSFSSTGFYFFPVGEVTSNPAYSPISVNVTAGSFSNGFVSVSVVDAIHPNNNSGQNYISRYWNVKQTGISGAVATIAANYVTPELLTPAETMIAAQLTGTFNVETNPWVRFSPLSGLTLTATGAILTEEISAFTGIKGGEFSVEITGGGNVCQNEIVTLTAAVAGGDLPLTYEWSDGLGTNSTAGPAEYIGTKDYSVTVIDANGRKATKTISVTTNAAVAAGTLSGNQTVCFSTEPNDIIVSGNAAGVKYWQRSEEPLFLNPISIANTTATLSGAEAGQITGVTYYRAAIDNGSCPDVFTPAITIDTKTTTWNGTIWSNGIPDSSTAIIISGDYNLAATITGCSITVINGAVVTIPAGYDVIINGALIVDNATFNLESDTNLIQNTDVDNFGTITVERESAKLFRLDYTMWGSPVSGDQTLKEFSPLTFSNRFYTYNSNTNLFNVIAPETNTFTPGNGYLIRMADNHIAYGTSVLPVSWKGIFTGVPTNGPVRMPLSTVSSGFNLTANPYASMIDADEFLNDNAAEIGGTLYFWRRRNAVPMGTEGTSAYYATYTLAGGAGVSISAIEDQTFTSETPNGLIQVGQGFLVQKNATSNPGDVVFNNTMRTASNNDDQFFRTSNTEERSRIWLNVTNPAGEFGQTLIAYMSQALNGVDRTDGIYLNDGTTALTSWLDNSEYIIQGRAPFVVSDIVPLNFKTITAGSYTIAIDHLDGLFAGNQDVFLRDNMTGILHNLKTGAYTFATQVGSFNARFEVVYLDVLSVDNPSFNSNSIVLYNEQNNLIINSGVVLIDHVEIYDTSGRLLIATKKINSSEVSINVGQTNQVLIVKITSVDGTTVNKKTIN
ncbi:T9SS sorting signal type C domain-containing protein [Flavobacterium tegetincola]|uniref:T9SS sorting signal type C domain-containing protein n=1 Tax=Flavobacterium tegetincola TaxID=150172 RepID=UPI00041A5F13|nr:T9SS sorting signal type C domain-containing protein [Flavobacterium tegetincola]